MCSAFTLKNHLHKIILFPAEVYTDYIPVSHNVLFNDNTGSMQTVLIPILNDECLENDEDFNVTLTTTMDCVQLVDDRLTITIVDDDSEFEF